jgi:hypothetical protein
MVEGTDAWETRKAGATNAEAVRALKEVLTRLEHLAVAISRKIDALERQQCQGVNEKQPAGAAERDSEGDWEIGTRVKVIRRDKYYGRVGKVVGQRGRHYVDVRLTDRPSQEVIYKKRDGLEVLKD